MSDDNGIVAVAERAVYRRVLRRETHSARSGASILVAIVIALLGLAAGAASVRLVFDVTMRHAVAEAFRGAPADRPASAVMIGCGIVAALIGLWLVLLAVLPGHRARHGRFDGRSAVLADDGVIADSMADEVASALGIDRSRVRTTIGHRTVTVVVTPTSGVAVRRSEAAAAVQATAAGLGTPLVPRIVVAERGVIA